MKKRASLPPFGTEKFLTRWPSHRHRRRQSYRGGRASHRLTRPFLRRPDLLKSLVVLFWQRHPSLSYMFAGLFIGPTSQAPRMDEARHDGLYELEIALGNVPKPGDTFPLWLVDRLFRNILTDVTGNTHRAEICIDKLYSPDGPTGRLGLDRVPLLRNAAGRTHEPRPAASVAGLRRLVLARAAGRAPSCAGARRCTIVSCFPTSFGKISAASLPTSGAPATTSIRNGSRRSGSFDSRSAAAVEVGGARMEIRQALEPWHVLGETGAVGGTIRYVDSSMERIQVKVDGFVAGRHIVTCNGRQMPMTQTIGSEQAVAGVRYKAWKPAEGSASDACGRCTR